MQKDQISNAYVRFHKYTVKGISKDFVEIRYPGDMRTVLDREVKEEDKERWYSHWEKYQRGEASKADGFPLEQWPEVDEGIIRELNYKNIYTVDQLASVSDTNLQNVGLGGRELRDKAKIFCDLIKDSQAAAKYEARFEQMKAENELLKSQLQELTQKVLLLQQPKPDRPKLGRPKKIQMIEQAA